VAIQSIEIIRGSLPFVTPIVTSYGTETGRNFLFVHIIGDESEGWGECVALTDPLYSSEFIDGADEVIRRYLLPMVKRETTSREFAERAVSINGHHMAKAAVESALLDYELRAKGESLARFIGATRENVPTGVAVGIHSSIDGLLETVKSHLDEGYQRIKIKIDRGYDIEPVRALREAFGLGFLLQVDANSAYSLEDAAHLAQLDQFKLLFIEQPFAQDDLISHVALAKQIQTSVCLDESISSFDLARTAIEIGACSVINVKPGRVGGLFEAVKIHDYCVQHKVAMWCGGMYETGIGRAMNIAFAALPGCTLPGDISASGRYFVDDVTEPFVMVDGHIEVPTGPGIGVSPRPDMLEGTATSRDVVTVAP
jgi:O-succinylbenzoate synthase